MNIYAHSWNKANLAVTVIEIRPFKNAWQM
jgi:hypothetical protein